MTTLEEMQNKVNLLKDELVKRETLMKNLSVRSRTVKIYYNIII